MEVGHFQIKLRTPGLKIAGPLLVGRGRSGFDRQRRADESERQHENQTPPVAASTSVSAPPCFLDILVQASNQATRPAPTLETFLSSIAPTRLALLDDEISRVKIGGVNPNERNGIVR
jgi:hypothetical protein